MKTKFLRGILMTAVVIIIFLLSIKTKNVEKEQEEIGESFATALWFSDVYFWNPPFWSTETGTVTGDITAKTGLALDITVPEENGDSRLNLMLINGNLPDIISIMDQKMIHHLVKSGKVWKLDEFLDIYGPDSHLQKDFPEDVKKTLQKRDGAWYAIPSHMVSADNRKLYPPAEDFWLEDTRYADGKTIIWNKSLLKRLGIAMDKLQTEEQVMAAFQKALDRKLTIDGNKVIPLLVDGTDYQEHTLVALQNFFGAEIIDDKGQYQDRILAPESKHALRFLNTAIRRDYLDADYFMIDNIQVKEYMASGRVLCFIGNITNTGIAENEWYSSAPILSDENTRPVLGISRQTTCGWISTFISKECKNPEAVAKWIDYMTSREGMLLANYGYEGRDYVSDRKGLVKVTQQGEKNRKEYSSTGISAWWPFVNIDWYFSITPKPRQGEDVLAKYQILCALGKYDATSVFDLSLVDIPVDYLNTNDILSDLETQINQYKRSQITAIIMSAEEAIFEKRYLNMISRLEEMGIVKIDDMKDRIYQQNCEEYQSRIIKVN